jgi:hypothetical protein
VKRLKRMHTQKVFDERPQPIDNSREAVLYL